MALMLNALPEIPKPENSPFVSYTKGTRERDLLAKEIAYLRNPTVAPPTLPLWINGAIHTHTKKCEVPHDRNRVLGYYCTALEKHVFSAIDSVLAAREKWSQVPWNIRLNIFRTAARLLEKKYLHRVVAAVMEDYSKNPYEAFIDVQELIDFWNFNVYYASTIYKEQPDSNADNANLLDYLPLEGFVFAIPPNNFVAIEGNLPTAPLMMGNVVIVKPSSDVVFSFHMVLKILHEAGLPKDVLAVLHGDSKLIGEIILNDTMLSGVHFTGGTEAFNSIFKTIGANIDRYRSYPRIVGETGGKDAIVVYDDHDPKQTADAIVMGGFGAQGRKCSATSRVYVTAEMWPRVRFYLSVAVDKIRVGDVADFRNFMGAIINEREHKKIMGYIERAEKSLRDNADVKEIIGLYKDPNGDYHVPKNGWFIRPIVIVTDNPYYETMKEEIFGPVVTICVLPKERFEKGVLGLCNSTSPYGLTGAIQTNDVYKYCDALHTLRYAAGNMYNWKTTGAMVNQQPFSGGRKSGTNSKVGWRLNLYNWVSPRTVGQTLVKPSDFAPPYLDE